MFSPDRRGRGAGHKGALEVTSVQGPVGEEKKEWDDPTIRLSTADTSHCLWWCLVTTQGSMMCLGQ